MKRSKAFCPEMLYETPHDVTVLQLNKMNWQFRIERQPHHAQHLSAVFGDSLFSHSFRKQTLPFCIIYYSRRNGREEIYHVPLMFCFDLP